MPGGKSSSAIALGVSATNRFLKASSTQARATILAPLKGPIWVSKNSRTLSTVSRPITPFSINSASRARTRAALSASRASEYLKRSMATFFSSSGGGQKVNLEEVRIDDRLRLAHLAPELDGIELDDVDRHGFPDAVGPGGEEIRVRIVVNERYLAGLSPQVP